MFDAVIAMTGIMNYLLSALQNLCHCGVGKLGLRYNYSNFLQGTIHKL